MTSLALTQPVKQWGLIPPLGNLDAYISAIHSMPLLTLEEEQNLAKQLKETGDLEAARKLVLSHLRLVVSVSRQYMGYGLPQEDLIQEGNVGLMKAVKRFDPSMGVRLVSYALHWIKAEIHEYIIKNWRMVKVATTKAQRKLFFNLRSLKQSLLVQSDQEAQDIHLEKTEGIALDHAPSSLYGRSSLLGYEVDAISNKLNVKPEEVREMERRMSGGDVAIDSASVDSDEETFNPIHYLSDARFDPVHALESKERDHMAHEGVAHALAQLDERSRTIVTERWLKVQDDGSGGMTLHELAAKYGVSAERIRQIEVAAMKKMKASLTA